MSGQGTLTELAARLQVDELALRMSTDERSPYPTLNVIQAVIREYGERLMTQKLAQKFDPRNFYPALLDLNQLILDMPHRAREIIDLIPAGRLTFGIKLLQAEEFLGGFHKIANRITVGVVIAALLIASALMMRTPRGETLAMFGFVAAAIAGLYLIVSTFIQDKHDKERAKLKGK